MTYKKAAALSIVLLAAPLLAAHADTIPSFIQSGGGDVAQQAQTTGKKLLDLLALIGGMILIGTFIWGAVQLGGDDSEVGKKKMLRSGVGLAIVGGIYVFAYFFMMLFHR